MDFTESLQGLSSISPAGFFLVFLVGIAMAFNPRSIGLIPVIIGYVSGNKDISAKKTFSMVSAFVLGMTVADVLLGVVFAYVGGEALALFGPKWEIFIGLALLFIGLRWLNLVRFRTIGLEMRGRKSDGVLGAISLGVPFSMSFCPFCVPYLLTILAIAATTGHVWYGALLMVFFSLGRGLPLLVAGLSMGLLKRMEGLQGYLPVFEKAGGAVLVIMGLYYLYGFSRYLAFF
jgi:cytochrome c-type biogenesis protein